MVKFIHNADTYEIKVQKNGTVLYKTFRCYGNRNKAQEEAKLWSKNFAKENDLSKDPHVYFRGAWRFQNELFYHVQYGSAENAFQAAIRYANEQGHNDVQLKTYETINNTLQQYSVSTSIDGILYNRLFETPQDAIQFSDDIAVRHNLAVRPRVRKV